MTLHERVGRVGSQRLTIFNGYVTVSSLHVRSDFVFLSFLLPTQAIGLNKLSWPHPRRGLLRREAAYGSYGAKSEIY